MPAIFKLGCNFDPRLIDIATDLNDKAVDGQIGEFFGSVREDAWLTARPAFRLPDIDRRTLAEYIARCSASGIRFNYTLNAPYFGSKQEVHSLLPQINQVIASLVDIGVARFTVSSPLLAELIRIRHPTVDLEVSTIAHTDSVSQIRFWHETYGIASICGNISKNRVLPFLRNAALYCSQHGISYGVIANEFCVLGGARAYGAPCIYRDSCYLCHSENLSIEDDLLFHGYPMQRCISARSTVTTWLRAPFIRPEDLWRYERIGIHTFKITGRTGSTEYIRKIASGYMDRKWHGNLISLWKNLETITSPVVSDAEFSPALRIDNTLLEGFLDKWFCDPGQDCSSEVCGETCCYCDDFALSRGIR